MMVSDAKPQPRDTLRDDILAIGHDDDRREWAYKIWFNLTAKGERVSADFVD